MRFSGQALTIVSFFSRMPLQGIHLPAYTLGSFLVSCKGLRELDYLLVHNRKYYW